MAWLPASIRSRRRHSNQAVASASTGAPAGPVAQLPWAKRSSPEGSQAKRSARARCSGFRMLTAKIPAWRISSSGLAARLMQQRSWGGSAETEQRAVAVSPLRPARPRTVTTVTVAASLRITALKASASRCSVTAPVISRSSCLRPYGAAVARMEEMAGISLQPERHRLIRPQLGLARRVDPEQGLADHDIDDGEGAERLDHLHLAADVVLVGRARLRPLRHEPQILGPDAELDRAIRHRRRQGQIDPALGATEAPAREHAPPD